MYQTILVPLDGSTRAEAILPHVESLATCYEARVIILGVVEPVPIVVPYNGMYPQFDEAEHLRRIDEMEAYLAGRRTSFQEKGIEAQFEVGHGPVVEEIIAAADRTDADLVAMASHGRTGLPRVFYGSVAAGVLHRINRPLLLIRSQGNNE